MFLYVYLITLYAIKNRFTCDLREEDMQTLHHPNQSTKWQDIPNFNKKEVPTSDTNRKQMFQRTKIFIKSSKHYVLIL